MLSTTKNKNQKPKPNSRPSSRPSSGRWKPRNVSYCKGDVVMTSQGLAVIRSIRTRDGIQEYGTTVPGNSNSNQTQMRYLLESAINRKLWPEDVITRLNLVTKALKETDDELRSRDKQLYHITKALEETNDELHSRDIQIKTFKKQLYHSGEQNKSLKQRMSESSALHTTHLKQIKLLEQTVKRTQRENKLESLKWKGEAEKSRHEITRLKQELNSLGSRVDKRAKKLPPAEMVAEQERLLQRKHERLRSEQMKFFEREQQLDLQESRASALRKQQQSEEEVENMRSMLLTERRNAAGKKKRLRLMELELKRQRQQLQREKIKNQANINNGQSPNAHRHTWNWKRQQKEKLVRKSKYLQKDFLDTVVKWRKKRDTLDENNAKIKMYDDLIVRHQQRLLQLEPLICKSKSKSEKKGKKGKKSKENKTNGGAGGGVDENEESSPEQVREYLDILDDLNTIEEDFDDAEHLRQLEFLLTGKDDQVEELQEEVERLKDKLRMRLQKRSNMGINSPDNENKI